MVIAQVCDLEVRDFVHTLRQNEAKPLWDEFIDWALQNQIQGVRHAGTTDALAYLLKYAKQLQTYCDDG